MNKVIKLLLLMLCLFIMPFYGHCRSDMGRALEQKVSGYSPMLIESFASSHSGYPGFLKHDLLEAELSASSGQFIILAQLRIDKDKGRMKRQDKRKTKINAYHELKNELNTRIEELNDKLFDVEEELRSLGISTLLDRLIIQRRRGEISPEEATKRIKAAANKSSILHSKRDLILEKKYKVEDQLDKLELTQFAKLALNRPEAWGTKQFIHLYKEHLDTIIGDVFSNSLNMHKLASARGLIKHSKLTNYVVKLGGSLPGDLDRFETDQDLFQWNKLSPKQKRAVLKKEALSMLESTATSHPYGKPIQLAVDTVAFGVCLTEGIHNDLSQATAERRRWFDERAQKIGYADADDALAAYRRMVRGQNYSDAREESKFRYDAESMGRPSRYLHLQPGERHAR
jgi:hypothetical protein